MASTAGLPAIRLMGGALARAALGCRSLGVRSSRALATGPVASTQSIPIIDIGPFLEPAGTCPRRRQQQQQTSAALGAACEHVGFFYVTNHGVDAALLQVPKICAYSIASPREVASSNSYERINLSNTSVHTRFPTEFRQRPGARPSLETHVRFAGALEPHLTFAFRPGRACSTWHAAFLLPICKTKARLACTQACPWAAATSRWNAHRMRIEKLKYFLKCVAPSCPPRGTLLLRPGVYEHGL